jgi:hypothetical protein
MGGIGCGNALCIKVWTETGRGANVFCSRMKNEGYNHPCGAGRKGISDLENFNTFRINRNHKALLERKL